MRKIKKSDEYKYYLFRLFQILGFNNDMHIYKYKNYFINRLNLDISTVENFKKVLPNPPDNILLLFREHIYIEYSKEKFDNISYENIIEIGNIRRELIKYNIPSKFIYDKIIYDINGIAELKLLDNIKSEYLSFLNNDDFYINIKTKLDLKSIL